MEDILGLTANSPQISALSSSSSASSASASSGAAPATVITGTVSFASAGAPAATPKKKGSKRKQKEAASSSNSSTTIVPGPGAGAGAAGAAPGATTATTVAGTGEEHKDEKRAKRAPYKKYGKNAVKWEDVFREVQNSNLASVARKHDIKYQTLYHRYNIWRNDPSRGLGDNRGGQLRSLSVDAEKKLANFIRTYYLNTGLTFSNCDLNNLASAAHEELKSLKSRKYPFHASKGWCVDFKRKYGVQSQIVSKSGRSPVVNTEEEKQFLEHCHQFLQSNGPSVVYVMDYAMWQPVEGTDVFAVYELSRPKLPAAVVDQAAFSVFLTTTADGTKCKPFIASSEAYLPSLSGLQQENKLENQVYLKACGSGVLCNESVKEYLTFLHDSRTHGAESIVILPVQKPLLIEELNRFAGDLHLTLLCTPHLKTSVRRPLDNVIHKALRECAVYMWRLRLLDQPISPAASVMPFLEAFEKLDLQTLRRHLSLAYIFKH